MADQEDDKSLLLEKQVVIDGNFTAKDILEALEFILDDLRSSTAEWDNITLNIALHDNTLNCEMLINWAEEKEGAPT